MSTTETRTIPMTDEQSATLISYLRGIQQNAGASPRRLLCFLEAQSNTSSMAYWRLTQTGALTIPTATGLLDAGVLKSVTLVRGKVRLRYASAAAVSRRLRAWVQQQPPTGAP